jgi:hypothetical protein
VLRRSPAMMKTAGCQRYHGWYASMWEYDGSTLFPFEPAIRWAIVNVQPGQENGGLKLVAKGLTSTWTEKVTGQAA